MAEFDRKEPMTTDKAKDLRQKIDAGVKTAVASALEEHRRAGRSVVVWEQGKVATLRPDEIGRARR
jgi:hypothetical protein